MSYINLLNDQPGIIALMEQYPETAKHLNALAESLLSIETETFSKAQRELIASYVSFLNNCIFCSESHAAVADYHAQNQGMSRKVWQDIDSQDEALKSLMVIAKKIQEKSSDLSIEDFNKAKLHKFTDRDLHDLVLISSAFCMYNRYVDGLGTFTPPPGDKCYISIGERLALQGYQQKPE